MYAKVKIILNKHTKSDKKYYMAFIIYLATMNAIKIFKRGQRIDQKWGQ